MQDRKRYFEIMPRRSALQNAAALLGAKGGRNGRGKSKLRRHLSRCPRGRWTKTQR